MNIVICDITGRTINYDVALCEAIEKELSQSDHVEFWSAGIKDSYSFKAHAFYSLVPEKYRSIGTPFTKVLKSIDTIMAYFWILLQLAFRTIDILHLQWFPFISLGATGSGIDIFFIRLLKIVSPKTKFVFTIHNMCPHSMKEDERNKYNPIYSKALKLFDKYIVHTEKTKKEVIDVLSLDSDDVHVIYHGIFKPKDFSFAPINTAKKSLNIIMYGYQNPYKGTDILIEGLKHISEENKQNVNVTICGAFDINYLDKCKLIGKDIKINWIPKFLTDQELYEQINKSDLIILPYRRISQSGVLLLALSTKRLVVTSNLPTFVETLKGFDSNAFFESENPLDLARCIDDYLNGTIPKQNILAAIEYLNNLYSWKESARKTIMMYNSI